MQEKAEAIARRPDQKIDKVMGRVLQTGVILAASVVFTGGAIFLSRHQVPVTNYKVFQGEPAELRTLTGILHQAAELGGRGLIQLGLLLLIATPVARVAFSLLAFLWQRDWTYALVTVGVLGLLLYSLFGGYRGG